MKNEWHIPQNGWHVAYPTVNKGVFLELHTDGNIIHILASNTGMRIPLVDIPKNRLSSTQWDALMHILRLAIGGEYD